MKQLKDGDNILYDLTGKKLLAINNQNLL